MYSREQTSEGVPVPTFSPLKCVFWRVFYSHFYQILLREKQGRDYLWVFLATAQSDSLCASYSLLYNTLNHNKPHCFCGAKSRYSLAGFICALTIIGSVRVSNISRLKSGRYTFKLTHEVLSRSCSLWVVWLRTLVLAGPSLPCEHLSEAADNWLHQSD